MHIVTEIANPISSAAGVVYSQSKNPVLSNSHCCTAVTGAEPPNRYWDNTQLNTLKKLYEVEKSGFRNAHLSAHFLHSGAGFSLFQRKCNLFFGITGLFHGDEPLCEMKERPDTSV